MGSMYARQEVETSIRKAALRLEPRFLMGKEPLTIVYKGSEEYRQLWEKKREIDSKYREEERNIRMTYVRQNLALIEQTKQAKQALQDKKDAELGEIMRKMRR